MPTRKQQAGASPKPANKSQRIVRTRDEVRQITVDEVQQKVCDFYASTVRPALTNIIRCLEKGAGLEEVKGQPNPNYDPVCDGYAEQLAALMVALEAAYKTYCESAETE